MANWGTDLWDQREALEKHTHNGIEFLDKCANFVKDRVRIETEYSKSLRKLVKQYQFNKKEVKDIADDNVKNYSYLSSFYHFLNETDDFAAQREVIAEKFNENILLHMHKLSADSKAERKKALQSLNELKSNLDLLHRALGVAKKKYDQDSEAADTAQKAYEQANQSLDLTKAQILKYQKISQEKGRLADKAKDDYVSALDTFNKSQIMYYDGEVPDVVNKRIQEPEEGRIEQLCGFLNEFSSIQQAVEPIITQCLEGMHTAAARCQATEDSVLLREEYFSGEAHPGNIEFEEWGKPPPAPGLAVPGSISRTSGSSMRSTQKKPSHGLFGGNKKKEAVQEGMPNDYAELPPAQRRKKFEKQIAKHQTEVQKFNQARAGLLKMAETCEQFGGDSQTIQVQIDQNNKETEKAQSLLQAYTCYLEALDSGTEVRAQGSPVLTRNPNEPLPSPPEEEFEVIGDDADGPPPPAYSDEMMSPAISPAPEEFDEFATDEVRCTILYDFMGNNEGELSVSAGEELGLIEDDDGSGWIRVSRGEDEGYVPASYHEKI